MNSVGGFFIGGVVVHVSRGLTIACIRGTDLFHDQLFSVMIYMEIINTLRYLKITRFMSEYKLFLSLGFLPLAKSDMKASSSGISQLWLSWK